MKRKERSARVYISHDVDRPALYGIYSWYQIAKKFYWTLKRGGNLVEALKNLLRRIEFKIGCHWIDPFWKFSTIMKTVESMGHRSDFHFLAPLPCDKEDVRYRIESRKMRRLVKRIHKRGHRIAFHGGLNSFRNGAHLSGEASLLRSTCLQLGIGVPVEKTRQHYLQIDPYITLPILDSLGFKVDETLGFADRPGFRCGTCREFPAYDLKARRVLSIHVRPLVIMEHSLKKPPVVKTLDRGRFPQAWDVQTARRLKRLCESYGGCFTLLWHNSEFRTKDDFQAFRDILA